MNVGRHDDRIVLQGGKGIKSLEVSRIENTAGAARFATSAAGGGLEAYAQLSCKRVKLLESPHMEVATVPSVLHRKRAAGPARRFNVKTIEAGKRSGNLIFLSAKFGRGWVP